jgi:hypothetical protein
MVLERNIGITVHPKQPVSAARHRATQTKPIWFLLVRRHADAPPPASPDDSTTFNDFPRLGTRLQGPGWLKFVTLSATESGPCPASRTGRVRRREFDHYAGGGQRLPTIEGSQAQRCGPLWKLIKASTHTATLLAKPSPLNIHLGSDRFSMFNKNRDIPILKHSLHA